MIPSEPRAGEQPQRRCIRAECHSISHLHRVHHVCAVQVHRPDSTIPSQTHLLALLVEPVPVARGRRVVVVDGLAIHELHPPREVMHRFPARASHRGGASARGARAKPAAPHVEPQRRSQLLHVGSRGIVLELLQVRLGHRELRVQPSLRRGVLVRVLGYRASHVDAVPRHRPGGRMRDEHVVERGRQLLARHDATDPRELGGGDVAVEHLGEHLRHVPAGGRGAEMPGATSHVHGFAGSIERREVVDGCPVGVNSEQGRAGAVADEVRRDEGGAVTSER